MGVNLRDMYKSDITTRSSQLRIELCHYMELPPYWHAYPMFANYWRLYCHDGEGAGVEWQGQHIAFQRRELYLIAPATRAAAVFARPTSQLFVQFHAGAPLHSPAPGVYAIESNAAVLDVVDELIGMSVAQRHQALGTLRCTYLITHALCQLPSSAMRTDRLDARIQSSIDFMLRHLASEVSIEDIAAQQGMTRSAFIRLFKQATGEPPYRYFTGLRVERACLILETTTLDIDSIAEQTGFCDRFHFSRLFKQRVGVSPVRYRDRLS